MDVDAVRILSSLVASLIGGAAVGIALSTLRLVRAQSRMIDAILYRHAQHVGIYNAHMIGAHGMDEAELQWIMDDDGTIYA